MGAVEGQNNKAKATSKKAYGFKSYEVIKVALYHTLGNLPESKGTHKFGGGTLCVMAGVELESMF